MPSVWQGGGSGDTMCGLGARGMPTGAAILEDYLARVVRLNVSRPCDPATLLMGLHLKETLLRGHKGIHLRCLLWRGVEATWGVEK